MTAISVEVNQFDDWGKVVGVKTVEMTQEQVADVVSHAAQLVAVHRAVRRSRGDMEGVIAELDEAMCATYAFETPQQGERPASNLKGWTSKPVCCPYCGSTDIREIVEWESTSAQDDENTVRQIEYQCQGACEGRSFWV